MTTEMPDRFSCDECRDEGKYIMHFAFSQYVEEMPDGPWYWNIMNHDKTSKFQWPNTFETKAKAEAFVLALVDDTKDSLGENVV